MPAYRARGTLPRALASIATCGLPAKLIEIVIASDDGTDYRPVPSRAFRTVHVPHGPIRTGPGAARNRALAMATGDMIAFMDADDTWGPGYLSSLLPLARRHGAAFGLTAILDGSREILRLPPDADRLTLSDLGRYGASFVPVMSRALITPFSKLPSQDVRHVAELLARLGGSAPLGRAVYQLRLNPVSVTAADGFSARVAAAYARHIADIKAGRDGIPRHMRDDVAQVFRDKALLNADYMAHGQPGEAFYEFIARRQDSDVSDMS